MHPFGRMVVAAPETTKTDQLAIARSEETAEVGGETAMADAEQQLDDQPANIHTHAIATE